MIRKQISLRKRIIRIMIFLVILQSLALVVAISISRVYPLLDAEAIRVFDNTIQSRVIEFNAGIGDLVSNMAQYTRRGNGLMEDIAQEYALEATEIYRMDEAYRSGSLQMADLLIKMLEENNITGAFFMLNGSNTQKYSDIAHAGVYIRNTAASSISNGPSSYQLEMGPISVAQEYNIATSINWDLDFKLVGGKQDIKNLYEKPIWAAIENPDSEIERYGFWQQPTDILGDNQKVVTYSLPLIDKMGKPYGVLGIEISTTYLAQLYLPNPSLIPFNSFYAITSMANDNQSPDWFVANGPLPHIYLKQGDMNPLNLLETGLLETNIEGIGKMYSLSQGLNIYSKNSPFIDSAWSIIGFVPQLDLHRSSSRVKVILMSSILITTLIGIIISILMGYGFTRKISGLSNYVKSLNPYGEINFNRTNLQEIDDLMSAVELFNKSVIRASEATSKILELSLLPIGGFEINQDLGTVILTEFTYDILGLDRGALVDRDTWEQSYQLLTSSPSDEYENTFYYKNTRDGTKHWLRILERKTEEGRLGVILDVTEDIKEKLRLIKELDYDPMTRLFNRDAFRREACEAIASQPDKIGALIFSDLDNLKYINDTYGHDAGDNLLVGAGKMFQEFAKHGGIVSRISGDEFAIFLHGFNSKKEIKTIIREKFLDFRGHVIETRDGFVHRIRFSSGLAWYPQDADNIMDLMKLADYAMYEAKHRERGSLFKFDRESYDKNVYLFENSDAINRLLDEELIRFDFQPIVNSRNGQVFGFEALMRSLLEDFKSPLEIITVAETQSKLGLLEHLVFRKAMSTMDDNMQALGDGKIFINSIPSQLISKKEQKVLANKYGHLFKNIIIEITEKEGDSPKQLDEKIDFIRSQGMKLAIDDFGKGYSNEVRIISLQPNIIKIDMELIQGIHWDLDKQILVNNLKIFSKTKGIKLVAEGIENTQDLEMVIKLGVDFLQGYYIGKPVDGFSTIPADLREEILYLNKYFDTWQHPHDGKELVK